jgi:ferredoxin
MSWILLLGLVLALGIAFLTTLSRRAELARMELHLQQRARADRSGAGEALLQFPVVDLSRCLGCGTCVAACPEEGVLELVHGQAGRRERRALRRPLGLRARVPVGAIQVTIANLEQRTDVPVVSAELESVSGTGPVPRGRGHRPRAGSRPRSSRAPRPRAPAAARRDAGAGRRVRTASSSSASSALGPAGLACALEAKRLGLAFVVIEQEDALGGTVARYPRRKLVLHAARRLPLHGPLGGGRTTFTKEELIALWLRIAREESCRSTAAVASRAASADADGGFTVTRAAAAIRAQVCLALGRRGSPRKLASLAKSCRRSPMRCSTRGRIEAGACSSWAAATARVETALGLAEQPGNQVVLSYRREAFFRIRSRNEERLAEAIAERRLTVLLSSELRAIHADSVDLLVADGGAGRLQRLANDEVFVMAGGVPPAELLARSGVSCDPSLRPAPAPVVERGTGLVRRARRGAAPDRCDARLGAVELRLLPPAERGAAGGREARAPAARLGSRARVGIAATVLIAVNLLYLVKRKGSRWLAFGSLRAWMTSHVATGILALCLGRCTARWIRATPSVGTRCSRWARCS